MNATMTALRAIVSGLRKSGAISDPHVNAIVTELEAADKSLRNYDGERLQVRELCMAIAKDAGVETSITVAEAPLDFNH